MRWVRQQFDVRTQTAKLELLYDEVIQQFRPESRSQLAPAV
jgi:hypothetical protein